jgi:threonine 3-dehydrogenase
LSSGDDLDAQLLAAHERLTGPAANRYLGAHMTDGMQALVYDRVKDPWEESRGLRVEEVAKPALDVGNDYRDDSSVLIRPLYTGFCGSDRGIWFRRAFKDMIYGSLDEENRQMRVIGHELFGRVVDVGRSARRESGLEPGDLVSAESHIICGVCYQCSIGETHVCADDKIIGISKDGCFAPYVKLPAKSLWRVNPKRIRPEVAAIQEPFGNAVHACTKVNLRGQTVAIIGCGTIGLFAICIARALGATQIIAIEPSDKNGAMASKLGADVVLKPAADAQGYIHDPDLQAKVRELTRGVGVDVALEMSGANSAMNNAIAAVRRGGDVILFGIKAGPAVIEKFDRLIVDGISMHSVIGRRIWETWHVTRNLLESRDPNIHDLIFDVILNKGEGTIVRFDQFEPASFEKAISEHPKVLLHFPE